MTGDFAVSADVHLDNSPTFQRMKQRGRIIIGVKGDQPYLGYQDPKTMRFSGFDVEIATLIAARLGFGPSQIDFLPLTSANRESDLVNGSVDMVVASFSITPSRQQQVAFAGPYLRTGESLLVGASSPINRLSDLNSHDTVCYAEGSDTTTEELQKSYHVQLRPLALYSACVNQLLQGTVQAVATDQTLLAGYKATYPGLRYLDETFSTELYGVGLPHGDAALQQDVDNILQQAEKDGTWQAIYNATLGRTGLKLTPPPIDFSTTS
jgi:glutamate transport system substrate-binding protein